MSGPDPRAGSFLHRVSFAQTAAIHAAASTQASPPPRDRAAVPEIAAPAGSPRSKGHAASRSFHKKFIAVPELNKDSCVSCLKQTGLPFWLIREVAVSRC